MERRMTRAELSRAALKSAFLDIFHTKEPEKITVVELCRRAGLNRSTFYAHYGYIDKLIQEVLWEAVAEVFVGMETQWNLPLESGGVARTVIETYISRFLTNPTVRRFCTCANSGSYRTLIIRAQVELTLGHSSDPVSYYTAYYHNAGILNFILEWFNNGMPIPGETVVEIAHEVSKVMYKAHSTTGRNIPGDLLSALRTDEEQAVDRWGSDF